MKSKTLCDTFRGGIHLTKRLQYKILAQQVTKVSLFLVLQEAGEPGCLKAVPSPPRH